VHQNTTLAKPLSSPCATCGPVTLSPKMHSNPFSLQSNTTLYKIIMPKFGLGLLLQLEMATHDTHSISTTPQHIYYSVTLHPKLSPSPRACQITHNIPTTICMIFHAHQLRQHRVMRQCQLWVPPHPPLHMLLSKALAKYSIDPNICTSA
jgi:hypothetical protein